MVAAARKARASLNLISISLGADKKVRGIATGMIKRSNLAKPTDFSETKILNIKPLSIQGKIIPAKGKATFVDDVPALANIKMKKFYKFL